MPFVQGRPSLSSPPDRDLLPGNGPASVTVDFFDTEVIAKIQHPEEGSRAPRLLATKQTIFEAVLLHHLIELRDPDFADSLVDRAEKFGERAAIRYAEYRPDFAEGSYAPAQFPDKERSTFFQELDISQRDLEAAWSKTQKALEFLENEGLVVDPAFTPELMVLLGLVPMQFSVRTPKGERVYREIKIDAPLWTLDITRGTKGGRRYTDIEFRFRGIEIVRRAIIAMAARYLETEERVRRDKGQPVLIRKGTPKIDGD